MAIENRHPDRDVGGLFSVPINPKTSKNIAWGVPTTPNITPIAPRTGISLWQFQHFFADPSTACGLLSLHSLFCVFALFVPI